MKLHEMATLTLLLILLLAAPPASLAAKHLQMYRPQWSPIDLTGEVVDSWCYASKSVGDGRGPDHAPCARACIHGGVTIGIVDDNGKMYIASKTKAYTGCQALLEPYVAKRVHIKGMLATIGGCPLLKINSVEEVKDGKTGTNANSAAPKYHGAASKPASGAGSITAKPVLDAKRQNTK
ncbi:MAG TPA: hypothetical protein V6D22_05935 [Candidatus Obscuribacterales bacterium]